MPRSQATSGMPTEGLAWRIRGTANRLRRDPFTVRAHHRWRGKLTDIKVVSRDRNAGVMWAKAVIGKILSCGNVLTLLKATIAIKKAAADALGQG